MLARAWLVRHGKSATNGGGPAMTPAAIALTDEGVQQAQRFAAALQDAPDLLVSSPFLRAQQSAAPLLRRWPDLPIQTWPIEELTYLSPARVHGATFEQRRDVTRDYWLRADPHYRDGPDAETFAEFVARLRAFDALLVRQRGFVLVVGHGQFFSAYALGRRIGFAVSRAWMLQFRQAETAAPLRHFEVLRYPLGSGAP